MKLFKQLTAKEIHQFQKWARKNYSPYTPINGMWHPVIQRECAEMNEENNILISKIAPQVQDSMRESIARLSQDEEESK